MRGPILLDSRSLPARAGSHGDMRHAAAHGDQRRDRPEASRPAGRLSAPRSERLDQQISQQSEQTAGVARGVEEVRIARPAIGRPRKPVLQQRRGRRQREERQADRRSQNPQGPPSRIGRAGLPDVNRQRQHGAGGKEHAGVHQPLPARRDAAAQRVRVEISEQQHGLEEDHARAPDRGTAAEHRQQDLPGQRLHHEEEGRRQENRECEERDATPNFQLPTPKRLSSKRLALGIGSWELGVDAT